MTNKHLESVVQHFTGIGGVFAAPVETLAQNAKQIQAVIFDWDGVFNDGHKGEGKSSAFSEADSMGTNMLRYGLWINNSRMPVAAIISGEKNRSAHKFALREHFDGVFWGIKDKRLAVQHLCARYHIRTESVACVFDDINDLAMAGICAIRCLINRPASPLFKDYVRTKGLCDYISGSGSGRYAVREIAELMLGLIGQFEKVIESRVNYDKRYRDYFSRRQSISTRFFKQKGDSVLEVTEVPVR